MSFLGGSRQGKTITPRVFSLRPQDQQVLPGPNVIDSTNSYDGKNTGYEWELRAGLILAMITATRKWVTCKRTTIAAGGSGSGSGAGSKILQVVDSRAFKVGEHITIEGTNKGTITDVIASIDYANDQITITTNTLQYNTGGAVYADPGGALAGAQIPRGILKETVFLRNLNDPIDAAAGNAYDKAIQVVYGDYVDVNYILGDYAACRAATNYLSQILWSDQQQLNS